MPVGVMAWLGPLPGKIRRTAREHVRATNDYAMGKAGPRGLRWVAFGTDSIAVVGMTEAFEIPRERCEGVYVDDRRMWIAWQGDDGRPCGMWSQGLFDRRRFKTVLEEARGKAWPVQTADAAEITDAISRGQRALQAVAIKQALLPLSVLVLVMVPMLILHQQFRPSGEVDPVRSGLLFVATLFAEMMVLVGVMKLHFVPRMQKLEHELWQMPMPLR